MVHEGRWGWTQRCSVPWFPTLETWKSADSKLDSADGQSRISFPLSFILVKCMSTFVTGDSQIKPWTRTQLTGGPPWTAIQITIHPPLRKVSFRNFTGTFLTVLLCEGLRLRVWSIFHTLDRSGKDVKRISGNKKRTIVHGKVSKIQEFHY